MKYVVSFMDHMTFVSQDHMNDNPFIDIDFNGYMKVRFVKYEAGLSAVNGVDGWGANIASEVTGKVAEVFQLIDIRDIDKHNHE